MLKLIIVGTVAAIASANSIVNQEMVDFIRQTNALWQPASVSENRFANYTDQQLQSLLGTVLHTPQTLPQNVPRVQPLKDLPSSFDSRTEWPGCVHAIKDQQQCGSCWAFAASEALSDRFCIASKGQTNVVLSPQDMVSCDTQNYACDGGYLNKAWEFLEKEGIPTDQCEPYKSGDGKTVPACPSTCTDSSQEYVKYKCETGSTKQANGVEATKTLISQSGPVETGFRVYADFYNYKSGVYHHVLGKYLGGHAVKLIGWGVDGNQNYWIAANSWGTSFGENGFFKIQQKDCGIDDATFGCTPQLNQAKEFYQ
ncbi:UNKNOWN [Stylonychia lemnae]|uniref:Peptidase C1A papain C-terminal domain-containing protein n=1 Tax=Stylonychia lemnae TaxID=5949 RepID=A0A078ACK5_STYLE|nr:UNKNOWN [Stylonychia lemnae]|eukprot:CDW79985.1 UNKNOWN [Stylonychia lemnae]